MACRNLTKATIARDDIINDLITNKHPNFLNLSNDELSQNLIIMKLDLASLRSIRNFADEFHARYNRLNYLILNAGVFGYPEWTQTVNGIE